MVKAHVTAIRSKEETVLGIGSDRVDMIDGSVDRKSLVLAAAVAVLALLQILPVATPRVEDLDVYFSQFGIGPNLPELSVSYAQMSTAIPLHHDQLLNLQEAEIHTGDSILAKQPEVTWSVQDAPTAMVIMVDLGPLGYYAEKKAQNKKPVFPIIHSMWTGCKGGSLSSCNVTKPYTPPGNGDPVKPNRYTFLLLKYTEPLVLTLREVPAKLPMCAKPYCADHPRIANFIRWTHFLFDRLLSDNSHMVPVAYNHMMIRAKPKST